jgi:hypothetical protein
MQKSLTSEQRLEILRSLDTERKWYSLDDERACVVCDRIFTGREIVIQRDQRGRYLLHCPTDGCQSFISCWFYVGNAATGLLHGFSRQQAPPIAA